MAWYLNHYHCQDCNTAWSDEWSCGCDDDCPACGSRYWSPYDSEDLTEIVLEDQCEFIVVRSDDGAEHKPRYRPIARFTSIELANRFIVDGELT